MSNPMVTFSFLLSLTAITLIIPRARGSAMIDGICSQTRDPPLCTMSLTSDPRSETAPLFDLAGYTIDMAAYRAADTKFKIHEAFIRATDKALKARYNQCDDLYLDILDAFRAGPGLLKGRQFGQLMALGERAVQAADGCEVVFGNNSPFRDGDAVVGVLGQALSVIAKNLS